MRLTPELFEQITGVKESALDQSQAKIAGDLREVPRLPLVFRSTACRMDGDKFDHPIQVQVCDFSTMGLGLTHALQDRLGKNFVIALKPRGKGPPIALYCETIRFQSAGPTRIRVAARFVCFGIERDVLRCLGLTHSEGSVAANSAYNAVATTPPSIATAIVPDSLRFTAAPITASPAVENVTATPDIDEVKRIRDAMLF